MIQATLENVAALDVRIVKAMFDEVLLDATGIRVWRL